MLAARMYYTATTLQDGTVLIVGGQLTSNQSGPALATTEIYDPARTQTTTSGFHYQLGDLGG